MRPRTRLRPVLASAIAGALILAGCSYEDTPLPEAATPSSVAPAAPADCTTDDATLASFAPDAAGGSRSTPCASAAG